MAQVLDILEQVVTEQVLRDRHAGEGEVRVAPGAVVTPSAWDFLRYHRLRLTRGGGSIPATPAPAAGQAVATAGPTIAEVLPPGSEAGVLSRGRCDHPDRPFGCRTEEFGSGFVEPSSCGGCAVKQAQAAGAGGCGCGGCNKAQVDDTTEALVQRLTDEIMKRLGTS